MTDLPRISIVVPSFRSSATIEETLKSIVGQDYPNKELIVVDGAGDDTARILERYDDRIHWWCSEPDGGQYDAIRKGFARAGGEVFFWLNADDKLLPGALDVVGEIFGQHADVRWLSSLAPGHYDAKGYYSGHGGIAGFSREAFLDGYNLPGVAPRGQWIQQEIHLLPRVLVEGRGGTVRGIRPRRRFRPLVRILQARRPCGRHVSAGRVPAYRGPAQRGHLRVQASGPPRPGRAPPPRGILRVAQAASEVRAGGAAAAHRGIAARRFGYVGRKIVRSRARHPDASWESVEHRWLPR
jgi:hypothetical protein